MRLICMLDAFEDRFVEEEGQKRELETVLSTPEPLLASSGQWGGAA